MAGSRKGERRGAAKGGSMFVKKGMPKAPGSGRKKGSLNKRPPVDVLGITLPHSGPRPGRKPGPSKTTEEYYREVAAVVTGEMGERIDVRDGMLEAFEYFMEEARSYRKMAQWCLNKTVECKTPDDFAQLDIDIEAIKRRVTEFYLLAGEMGQKVIPFVKSRLSAVVIASGNDNPVEAIGLLLQEIDEANRGRPTWAPPQMKLVSSG